MNPLSDLGAWGYALFWGITILAVAIFAFRIFQLWRYVKLGRAAETFTHLGRRFLRGIADLYIQKCQLNILSRRDRAGVGHLFMAWGFLIFVVYYTLFIIIASGFGISEPMEHNGFYVVYTWIMDIAGPFIMIGAAWGIIRRYFVRPSRIEQQRTWEAGFILFTVLVHPITHFGKIATQIAYGNPPAGLGLAAPPISNWLSQFYTAASAPGWHVFWFWAHWVFVLLVLGIIVFTRYLHFPAGVLNDMLTTRQPKTPKGLLNNINIKDQATFGAGAVNGFTQKQLFDTYACVICGRCQDACPAYNTQKPLNPRVIIRDIKQNLLTNGPRLLKKQPAGQPLIGDQGAGSVSEEVLWECTTCAACMEACPMYIEHVPKIIDMRRYLVQMRAKFPPELLTLFENMEQRSNPWGIAPGERAKWAVDVAAKPFVAGQTEYLYYVGCAGSFDSRSKQVSVALANVLNAAGVSWGILGTEEKCCGDSLRRTGNEFVFERMMRENIKLYQDKGVTKIITQCPHCYSTLKNDYAGYGFKIEVRHHTEFIRDLIAQGRLKADEKVDLGKIAIHDSCYLGRYNGIFDEPRDTIAAVTGKAPAEMAKNRTESFCCGAGGGRMWMEESIGTRINHARVQQALDIDPNTICVACPYCLIMFEDGVKDTKLGDRVHVLDVAEVVAMAVKAPTGAESAPAAVG